MGKVNSVVDNLTVTKKKDLRLRQKWDHPNVPICHHKDPRVLGEQRDSPKWNWN